MKIIMRLMFVLLLAGRSGGGGAGTECDRRGAGGTAGVARRKPRKRNGWRSRTRTLGSCARSTGNWRNCGSEANSDLPKLRNQVRQIAAAGGGIGEVEEEENQGLQQQQQQNTSCPGSDVNSLPAEFYCARDAGKRRFWNAGGNGADVFLGDEPG